MCCEVRNSEDEVIGSESSIAAQDRERRAKMLWDIKFEKDRHQTKKRQQQASQARRAKASNSKFTDGPVMESSLKTFLGSGPTAVDDLDSYR